MNVWQWQGAAPGQYKITVTDSLNRSVVYNYTITAPPAIASNNSVLHHTSSRTSCDGSLTVNPSNGTVTLATTSNQSANSLRVVMIKVR